MRTGIGVDFGTTNSSIAVAADGRSSAVRFQTQSGETETFRSVLYFEPRAAASTGPEAIEHYLAADEKGRLVQSLKSFLATKLFTSTSIFGRQYTIEDLIAIMLRELRARAERQIGHFEGPIVFGRPVRYSNASTDEDNDFAVSRLKRAIAKAGIGEVFFEYEPVAAAYFYESTLQRDELIIIGDFGGGTSDFSLLRVGPEARRERGPHGGILGTEGVALAGDAFDGRIVRNVVSPALGRGSRYRSMDRILPMPAWVYSDLERWHYLSFLKSPDTLQMLRSIQSQSLEPGKIAALLHIVQEDLGFYLHRSVQKAKEALSAEDSGRFEFEDYTVNLDCAVRREDFEDWIREELAKIRTCVDLLLTKTGTDPDAIDRVFLTGGSSFVPAVRRIFEERFGAERITAGSEFTSVAKGLALRALEIAAAG